MIKTLTVELTENDVKKAIKEYVKKHHDLAVTAISVDFERTGDYDRGTYKEYIGSCTCECKL